ncbi:MAG TPA: aminotransferase class III-fold pyridoxal phosphate-dependent enzyme [Bacteriovoracaceae bacterium]|nr:aminotransferase class III-fold pyridoxal phosphate-dependent enzyme [Bacteriovoracaceae bacterium]
MEKNTLTFRKTPEKDPESDLFRYFARPMTSKLLETMELAKHFHHGDGDYLFYKEDGKTHKVLDLTGGYGANLLGHRNPRLMKRLLQWHEDGAPNLTQGSIRRESGKLAKRISETLQYETSEGPWITTFSNSGTEAIEAAVKHCLIYFQHKLVELEQVVEKEINQAMLKLNKLDEQSRLTTVTRLRVELVDKIENLKMNEERKSYLLHQLNNVHTLVDLVDLIRTINAKQLMQRPSFISLEKAYHGKTMGALALTSNEGFRNAFYLDEGNNTHTHFISQYMESGKLDEFIQSTFQDLILIAPTPTGVACIKHSFSLIAGAFVEPIQGEAGVVTVSSTFIALLKKYSLQQDFLLVFDEIQAGMYRTGKLASGTHTDITADIYTFSKSLGGGIAKIAATSINSRKYIEEFGMLHTSTFSEDDFSSAIALEVLDILQGEDSPLKRGMSTGNYLSARLEWLKSMYPEAIKEVRGMGLMLAIEFKDVMPELGFEFKTICDANMQGYMIASALLNHEGLRMSPSLSNNLTLRIAPSIYFGIIQVEELISGLINLCEAMTKRDVKYFLSAIYPGEEISNVKSADLKTDVKTGVRPLAVFLCHLIDEAHVKKVTNALVNVPGPKLLKKLALTKDLASFEIYHTQTLTDNNGVEMDIVMLGVPVTSEELKRTFTSRSKYKIVQKVQAAVDYAHSLGANTVGLGQFTSIVSGNGLYLNPRGMNLTTGNAFTVGLMVQSALRSVEEKKIELQTATVALIGAAGNIMSVASSLMADHVGKVILIHHSPIESSLKYHEATKRILAEVAGSNANSEVVKVVKQFWTTEIKLLDFLNLPEVQKVFKASSEITDIQEAEIVLCGASASTGFLTLDHFKKDAVIVDVAVPPTIKPEMLVKIGTDRPDLTYHLGGVARIPNGASINFSIFPLGVNECYACMAETFALGFSGKENLLNIGDLNKSVVMEVQVMADKAGFVLGSYKSKSSL